MNNKGVSLSLKYATIESFADSLNENSERMVAIDAFTEEKHKSYRKTIIDAIKPDIDRIGEIITDASNREAVIKTTVKVLFLILREPLLITNYMVIRGVQMIYAI